MPSGATRLRAERPERVAGARTSLTGRAAVLALVVCALALALAYPLRAYLEQRGRIAELRERTAAQEQRVAELRAEQDRWQDPAFVRQQARERLNFVLPGETRYVVLEPGEDAVATPAQPGAPPEQRAWYGTLWQSLTDAGATSTDPRP